MPRRTIVSFAAVVSGALLVLGLYQRAQDGRQWVWVTLLVLAAALMLCALVAAPLLRPVYRGWMRVGEALGWVNTRVLLTLVFFLVVTPTGLVMRLLGRSPMSTPKRDSYWTDVEPHSYGDRHVDKQF